MTYEKVRLVFGMDRTLEYDETTYLMVALDAHTKPTENSTIGCFSYKDVFYGIKTQRGVKQLEIYKYLIKETDEKNHKDLEELSKIICEGVKAISKQRGYNEVIFSDSVTHLPILRVEDRIEKRLVREQLALTRDRLWEKYLEGKVTVDGKKDELNFPLSIEDNIEMFFTHQFI